MFFEVVELLEIFNLIYMEGENINTLVNDCVLEWDDPPKHLLLHSTINSPECQEFMV